VNEIRLPLGLSVAGHAICLVLLILLLPTSIPPVPEPLATGGMEVVLAQLPKQEEPPPRAETPPPPVETPPPEPTPPPPTPEEPVATIEPPPPAPEVPAPVVEPPPPPAPRKPIVKPPPKPVVRRPEQTQPTAAPTPTQPTSAAIAAPQTAYAPTPVPAPVPSNEVSPGYRALLSAWLESHKRYPDSARQRGEEGHVILRFAVDRSGRVLNFALAQSSGFPDIDASIEEMMRNATLPPFPATMTQPRIDVSVTVRFSLAR
jgi:periplasmic protein TonB